MKEKKILFYLSHGQLNFKEFEMNMSIGFKQEKKYLYSSSERSVIKYKNCIKILKTIFY